jgi:hypothetical protein
VPELALLLPSVSIRGSVRVNRSFLLEPPQLRQGKCSVEIVTPFTFELTFRQGVLIDQTLYSPPGAPISTDTPLTLDWWNFLQTLTGVIYDDTRGMGPELVTTWRQLGRNCFGTPEGFGVDAQNRPLCSQTRVVDGNAWMYDLQVLLGYHLRSTLATNSSHRSRKLPLDPTPAREPA